MDRWKFINYLDIDKSFWDVDKGCGGNVLTVKYLSFFFFKSNIN